MIRIAILLLLQERRKLVALLIVNRHHAAEVLLVQSLERIKNLLAVAIAAAVEQNRLAHCESSRKKRKENHAHKK